MATKTEKWRDADFAVLTIAKCRLLERIYAFDERSYVGDGNDRSENIPFGLFQEWWKALPTGFIGAFHKGEPVAVIGMFPVTQAWADGFLQHRVSELELTGRTIEEASAIRRTWYFSGLSSSIKTKALKSRLPCFLGQAILRWMRKNANLIRGSEIVIVAEGATPIGKKILSNGRFGFEPFPAPGGQEKPRFSLTTTLAKVRRLLVEDRFFAKGNGLRDSVMQERAESR
jgi:hypothetical protein